MVDMKKGITYTTSIYTWYTYLFYYFLEKIPKGSAVLPGIS